MKVLLGVGADDDPAAALDPVVERAREAGDDLTVAVYAGGTDDDLAAVERRVRDRLDALDCSAAVVRVEGDPGSQLVERADTGEYDRLVMPGGTRSPMGKIRLSDAAEFVLLNARTSVTLLR